MKEQIKGEKARVLFGFVVVICCEKFKDFLVYWLMIEEPRRDGWKVGKREGKKMKVCEVLERLLRGNRRML